MEDRFISQQHYRELQVHECPFCGSIEGLVASILDHVAPVFEFGCDECGLIWHVFHTVACYEVVQEGRELEDLVMSYGRQLELPLEGGIIDTEDTSSD